MRDRIGTNNLANGAVRYGAYDAGGNLLRYAWLRPEDEPLEAGTPLNRETLLSAEAEAVIWPASGKPAMTTYDLVERAQAAPAPAAPRRDMSEEYVTRREFEELVAKLTAPSARPARKAKEAESDG